MLSPRQRFVDYVRRVPDARPVVSPFLPKPGLVNQDAALPGPAGRWRCGEQRNPAGPGARL